MSIASKIDNWIIKKIAKDKVKHLLMVPKKVLFDRIYELNNYINQLEYKNETLADSNRELREALNKQESKKALVDETKALEKELQQMKENRKINKTELAYEALVKRCEELQQENKSIKGTLDIAHTALQNTNKQNKLLENNIKIQVAENRTLYDQNQKLKADVENKEQIRVVNHNFSKNENTNNNRSINKKTMITRQVNN